MGAKDNDIVASLKICRDGHPKDIPRFKHEERIQSSKWFLGMRDHHFCNRGAKPAERGFLSNRWQTILHPLEHCVAAAKVVDHANGKPAHEDGTQNDNDGL
jgi:hypothetical protein